MKNKILIYSFLLFISKLNAQVVLNELMVRPPGSVSTPPNGLIYNSSEEYIEIYNNSCSTVNIAGYFIATKTWENAGGTMKIPNVAAATLVPGGHVVIGSANPGGAALGNIDISLSAADYCVYNGNFILQNVDGWCALYNASGIPIDCIYWSSSAANLTSNTSDYNPGALCLPAGTPSTIVLQTPIQINTSFPGLVKYGGPNPAAGSPICRHTDGSSVIVQNLSPSIAANNCNGGTCVAVSSGPTAIVVNPTNASCGQSNGSVLLGNVTGGTSPYTYSVTSVSAGYSSTTSYTNVSANTYTVNVKDANNCVHSETFTVSNTSGPTAVATTTTAATCGNNNGSITLGAVTGGVAPYTYSVSTVSASFGSATSFPNLAGGNYTVSIRDANACTYTVSVNVPTAAATTSVAVTTTNSTCGNANGIITIGAVTGGTSPFTYSVSSLAASYSTSTSYTNATAATYTVSVKDASGCVFTRTVAVSNTAGPTNVVLSSTNSTCGNANGTISIGAVTGGTSPFTYSVVSLSVGYTSTTTYTNASASTYTVNVKDANGCVFTKTVAVTNTSGPTSIVTNTTTATCGNNNGSISLGAVTGGTSPYSYSFNNGAFSSTTLFLNLAAGNYSIQVKDANNCIFITSATLTAPPAVDPTFNTISPICSGATLSPLPTTSSNNITGTWLPAVNNQASTTYTFTPTTGQCANTTQLTVFVNQVQLMASSSVNDCGNNSGFIRVDSVIGGVAPFMYQLGNGTPQSTNLFYNLQGGNYVVSATDNNGCTASANMNIASVQAVVINFTTNNANCSPFQNATLTANVSGGSSPYQYNWLGTSNTSASINNLQAGTYTCYVSDIYSCSAMQSITIIEPSPLTVSITSTNTECGLSTGSAIATVSGGTIPYIYQWSSGSQQAQANELTSGQYAVQIYDANGCNTSGIANINTGNGPVVNLLSIQHATCYGAQDGGLSVNVTGGVPPYTINWNSGQTTTELTNVPGGYYDIVVTDVTNCQSVQSFEIMQPAPYTFNFTYQEPPCGSSTGSISAQVTGGVAPYVYQWSSNANDQTTPIASNLAADIYTLTVTDANNCAYYEITNLSNANNNVQIQVDNVQRASCGTVSTGSINITPTGGVAPYTYQWSNGATTEDISSLSPGGYYVNTTDATGCRAGRYVEVQSNSVDYQPEICLVTVDTALSRNQIIWEKTVQQGIKSFKIYREFSTNNYQAIAEVPFAQQSMYTDVNANPAVRSFRYKISAVDSCDVETPLSSKHKTIHLVQFPALGGSNSLIWDFYDGYTYDYFFIWRDDPSTGWMKIDSMPSNLTSYTDITPPSIDARYMIEIVPPSPCVSTMKNGNPTNDLFTTVVKSKSNIRNNRQNTVAVKNQTLNSNDLKVYPNPATNSLTIELSNLQPSNLQPSNLQPSNLQPSNLQPSNLQPSNLQPSNLQPTITIENMLGQLLYQSKINQNKSSINISNFQPGVYLVKVLTEKGLMVKSVVVER